MGEISTALYRKLRHNKGRYNETLLYKIFISCREEVFHYTFLPQLKDFYQKLHAYVRYKLRNHYMNSDGTSPVDLDKGIPAQILGMLMLVHFLCIIVFYE